MIRLKTSIKDLGGKARLGRLAERMSNPEPAIKECGLVLLRSIAKTFKAGGRPKRWKKSKRAKAGGGKTLIDTARLKNSITMRVSGKFLRVGTSVKYAAIHHLGGEITNNVRVKRHYRFVTRAFGKDIEGRKVLVKSHDRKMNTKIQARPFLVIQKEDRRVFDRILGDYVTS